MPIHLFGHTHDTQPNGRRAFDIGVESIGIAPMTFVEIKPKMATLPDLLQTKNECSSME